MAAQGGTTRAALDQSDLERDLFEQPYLFEFFQAVWLAERFARGRAQVGAFAQPRTECLRFAVHNTASFPASEIQSLERRPDRPARMLVNFMGLTGPEGVLPLYYTQLLKERARARDTAGADFFDIFNHRIISLFYRAWEKYRFGIEFARSGRDPVSRRLFDFIGLGTAGLAERQAVPDHALLYYAGLLSARTRSAQGLRQLLEDYFDVPVEIEQFAGTWYRLDPNNQCLLDENPDESERIAFGAVVGDEVWNQQGRIRIRLGPLALERYEEFLPGGSAYEPLRALTRFYAGDELDYEVQLVLRRDEVPRCDLGGTPRLGWTSWAKTADMHRDPGETILQL